MRDETKKPARRSFLVGLVTGAGAVAALSGAPEGWEARPPVKAVARKETPREAAPSEPILYRRSEESERYYRTLYR